MRVSLRTQAHAPPQALSVEADVALRLGSLRIRLVGRGSVLTCRIDGSSAGALFTRRASRSILMLIRTSSPLLARAGIRLDVMVGRVCIARAGSGVKQNAAARLLRLPAAHLGP